MKFRYFRARIRIKETRKKKELINKVIREYGYTPGDLSFIFTNDEEIIKINREFLKHHYPTDVISFRINEGKRIDGEVYISVETVKYNAKEYKVSFDKEVLRILIHGTLHLIGFDDKTKEERAKMTELEEIWLKEY